MHTRRSFLKTVAATAATAGCRPDDDPSPFPQGVASGDPGPDRVVLWTRVSRDASVEVRWEIATDPGFARTLTTGTALASADADYCVRVVATGLPARSTLWYRFEVDGAYSPTGRTRTAPAADDPVPVRFAWASCQDFPGRWYHAWRALTEESEVDFVLFVGDYIYETAADERYQDPTPFRRIELPDGRTLDGSAHNLTAVTLDDYRSLYRQIRSDPDLQEAHRLFPFVMLWDDHEFANDAWQDHSVDHDERQGDEQDTARREAATRAWAEYMPTGAAYDAAAGFPRDIQVYRTLRWGAWLELVLLDVRYYRDDHLVPEGPIDVEVGKFLEHSPLGSRIFVLKDAFDAREADARPTMLGDAQLAWSIEAVRGSDAVWKGLVSPLPMFQLALDLREEDLPLTFQALYYFKTDLWDGFRSERRELLQAIGDTPGLVVFSGDLHGNYVADVHDDYDAPGPPIAAEFAVTSVSSATILEQLDRTLSTTDLLDDPDLHAVAMRFDEVATASNPHLRYANSHTYGLAVAEVSADTVAVELLEIDDVHDPIYSGVTRRKRFVVPLGGAVRPV